MMKLDGNKYKVLECKGVSGLTVGSHVLRPGSIFLESQWPYGDASLRAAIAKKRCKLIKPKKKEKENDSE